MSRRAGLATVAVFGATIVVVLAASSIGIARDTSRESTIRDASDAWASQHGWKVLDIGTGPDGVTVRFAGPLPVPDTDNLETLLRDDGIDPSTVVAELIPETRVELGTG